MLLKTAIIILLPSIFSTVPAFLAGSEYEVTVVTTPSSGPFLTRTVVDFFCLVDPVPPEPVTYNWEFQRNAQFLYSDFFTGQNLSHRQFSLSFRFIWFFCKVYSNDTLVAVGSKLAEYYDEDVLYTTDAPVQTFAPGGTVTFNVTNSGLHGVTWYHNGIELEVVEGSGRISVSERQLIICQAVSSDAGVYQLEITSLFSGCTETKSSGPWFDLLKNLAAFASVTFLLQETNQGAQREYDPYDVLPNQPVDFYYSESNSQFNISGTYNISANTSFLNDDHELLWVHNGTRLDLNEPRYHTLLSLEPGKLHLTLEIHNFTDSDAGFYIGVVNTEPTTLFSHFGCDRVSMVGASQIPIGIVLISVQNIGFLNITFALEPRTHGGSTTLTCGIDSNAVDSCLLFTLIKANMTLTSNRNSLVFNASSLPNPYGLYVCTVEQSTKNASLLLQEHAKFYFQVSSQQGACQEWLDNSTKAGLAAEIKDLFQRFCSCSESPTVEITAYECSPSGGFLSLEGVLVYSDEEGRITASTLINMLTLWTVTVRPPLLTVNGVQYTLQLSSNTCPFLVSSFQNNMCFESFFQTCPSDKDLAGVFGGLFVGGFLAGVILSCVVCTVVVTWLQYRCKQTPGDSSTSVKIHTNDAYGIAHVRESTHDEHHNAKVGRHTQGFEVQVQEN